MGSARGIAGLEEGPTSVVYFGGLDGDELTPDYAVDRPGFSPIQPSTVEATAPGVLRITANTTSGFCTFGDVGTYRWSIAGGILSVEPIDDECDARRRVLVGSRQRSLAHDSRGGEGVVAAFEPYFRLRLPEDVYVGAGSAEVEAMVVDSETATYKVWKDLDGWADPCDIEHGRSGLEPGMDAFVGYLETDERFTVLSRRDTEIDGHRAVDLELRVGDRINGPCWTLDGQVDDRTGVLTWVTRAAEEGSWNAAIGDPLHVVVTEVDGASLTFEFLRFEGGAERLDQDALDSVRFSVELPPAPPS